MYLMSVVPSSEAHVSTNATETGVMQKTPDAGFNMLKVVGNQFERPFFAPSVLAKSLPNVSST